VTAPVAVLAAVAPVAVLPEPVGVEPSVLVVFAMTGVPDARAIDLSSPDAVVAE
jgi:hypothetical protein